MDYTLLKMKAAVLVGRRIIDMLNAGGGGVILLAIPYHASF